MDVNDRADLSQKILGKVLLFLSYRARTRKEIEQRLEKYLQRYKKLTPPDKDLIFKAIFSYLEQNKLINDEEFVRLYVESKSSGKNVLGKRAITQKLMQKGISRSEAEEYVEEAITPVQELQSAVELLKKKYHLDVSSVSNIYDRAQTDKMGKYLLSRGFSYQTARSAVDYLLKRP